ncbi:MAG: restriction endonuclease subunit S [Candidatus Aenigmatarchaeota archaeon]
MKRKKQSWIDKIPEDWEVVKLDNLIEVETGKRERGGGLSEGDVASIGGEYIDDQGNILWNEMKFISEEFYNSLTQGKVKVGDILLVKDGATTGKVAFVKSLKYDKVAVNEHVFIIRCKEKIMNEFLFYFLFSQFGQTQIKAKFHGIIGGIIKKDLEKILIPLPPLPEQKAIAQILSTVDEAIQKVDEIIAKTERLKKGLMQNLLTKGIGHKEFKDSEIGRIPKEWEITKIKNSNIAEIIMGQSPPSSTYNTSGDGLPFLQGKAEFGSIYPTPVMYTSQPTKIAEKGDILISVRAPVGDVNLCPFRLCIGRGLAAIRIKGGSNLFYFYWLQKAKKTIENIGKGSTFKAIAKSELENIWIPIPYIQEQQKIAEILSTVDKKLELERKRKEKLERIKKGLMNDLLTGRKRVKL